MPDMTAAAALMSSLTSAVSVLKALGELRDFQKLAEKLVPLYTELAAATAQASALAGENAQLQDEVRELKRFAAEKERYQLEEVTRGVFAYALKESERRGEPLHRACATCFDQGKKSILQRQEKSLAGWLVCGLCRNEIPDGTHQKPGMA
jgi:hypothetical protein